VTCTAVGSPSDAALRWCVGRMMKSHGGGRAIGLGFSDAAQGARELLDTLVQAETHNPTSTVRTVEGICRPAATWNARAALPEL
jgi:hypothetical protein